MDWDLETLRSYRNMRPFVWNQLMNKYLRIFQTLISLAVGIFLHLNIGGILTLFEFIGIIVWVYAHRRQREVDWAELWIDATFYGGASLSALIHFLKPDIGDTVMLLIASVSVGTAMAFGCFWVAAMLLNRRDVCLYLGGSVFSGLVIFFWLHFASAIFGGYLATYMIELHIAILLFAVYIGVYLHKITIEEGRSNDINYVFLACSLLANFPVVLICLIIIILTRKRTRRIRRRGRRHINRN